MSAAVHYLRDDLPWVVINWWWFGGLVYKKEMDLKENKKVKFSHTRYRALGPELIPVYRQSARR